MDVLKSPPNALGGDLEGGVKVIIDHGWTEMGQGVHTMAVQALVTETGIPPSMIEVRVETSSEMVTGMTTASRATSLIGNAIIDACKRFKEDLEYHKLEELVGPPVRGRLHGRLDDEAGRDGREDLHALLV